MFIENMRLVAPMVTSLHASVIDEQDPHVVWSVGYAPEIDDDGERYLLSHLHVGGADGTADVEVSAYIAGGPEGEIDEGDHGDEFAAMLTKWPPLGGIYTTARAVALGLFGTIEADGFIPLDPPEPKITQLIRPTAGDES